jgi:hypothetical protein
MTNFWDKTQSGFAIAIGINQYQNFQPLNYAQRDAQAFRDFLVNEAGFSTQQVLLLTDTSPTVDQGATYPDRDNIQAGIAQFCQQMQSGDWLWVIFSGYGVQMGGQDYLMPIEGDPGQVETTGIAIASLFSMLKSAPTDNILLLLDMNRSQGVLAGQGVGEQTLSLARASSIPTLLSCQPDQFSHETLGLRQGLFTAAVLEALRCHGSMTLEHLAQYLSDRLPQLSEHHWRPQQHPIAIIPDQKRYQLILPGKIPAGVATADDDSAQTLPSGWSAIDLPARLPSNGNLGDSGDRRPSVALIPVPDPTLPSQPEIAKLEGANPLFFQRLLIWSGIIALLLLLGVLLRNWAEFTKTPDPTPVASNSPVLPPAPALSPAPAVSPIPASPPPPVAPLAPSSPVLQAEASAPAASASTALDEARTALNRSIATTPSTQVSAFNDAIEQARTIPAGDPLYAQAQQEIDRWSRTILSVAEQRARQSNGGSYRRAVRHYRSAIEAARLVPRDRPALYARAQSLIRDWDQKIKDSGY